jgi:hypothetical protein
MCEPLHTSLAIYLPQRRTPQIGPASGLAEIISIAGTENGAISKSVVPLSRDRGFESAPSASESTANLTFDRLCSPDWSFLKGPIRVSFAFVRRSTARSQKK